MVEYKELERALLARMFRQGLIDGTTFSDRLLALGYSPDDVILMLNLESKEGARVVAWEGSVRPRPLEVPRGSVMIDYTDHLSLLNGSYGYLTVTGRNEDFYDQHELEFIFETESNAVVDSIKFNLRASPYPAVGDFSVTSTFLTPGGATKFRVKEVLKLSGSGSIEVWYPMIKVEVMVV